MGYYRNLKVWQKSQDLTEAVYLATGRFPRHELYSLVAQMRRACASISFNIAEGTGKLGDREMARFLRIARGSATELDSQIDLSRRLGYISPEEDRVLSGLVNEIQRMLFALIRTLTAHSS